MFQKEFHDFNSILLAGNMKRSEAVLKGTKAQKYMTTFLEDTIPPSVVKCLRNDVL